MTVEGTGRGESNVELLAVRGLSKSFGPIQALTEVDLDVPAGKVTALCGDNGAGKSVLIKCIAGALERSEERRVGKECS